MKSFHRAIFSIVHAWVSGNMTPAPTQSLRSCTCHPCIAAIMSAVIQIRYCFAYTCTSLIKNTRTDWLYIAIFTPSPGFSFKKRLLACGVGIKEKLFQLLTSVRSSSCSVLEAAHAYFIQVKSENMQKATTLLLWLLIVNACAASVNGQTDPRKSKCV